MAPLLKIVQDAKAKFLAQYGFPAERMHVSRAMEKVVMRWARDAGLVPREGFVEGELAGLELRQMTHNSLNVEFWLSTERNGMVYSSNSVLTPDEVGMKRVIIPGETYLGD